MEASERSAEVAPLEAADPPSGKSPASNPLPNGVLPTHPTGLQPAPSRVHPNQWEDAEKRWMLGLARESVVGYAQGAPPLVVNSPPVRLLRKQGCFVTLYRLGTLRGCIGSVQPLFPLYHAIVTNARAAASSDPRFAPVTAAELPKLKIQISILTEPQPLCFDSAEGLLSQLTPGASGVLLQMGHQVGTFLPQVWRQIPDRTEFLNRLAEKAGLPAEAWRWSGAVISVYAAECFEEPHERVHN